jgi:hypothetical protein
MEAQRSRPDPATLELEAAIADLMAARAARALARRRHRRLRWAIGRSARGQTANRGPVAWRRARLESRAGARDAA